MATSSGSPDRCPVCGIAVRIEPYLHYGEMLCPGCGTLLWFFVLRGEPHFFLPEEIDSLDFVELVMGSEEEFR